jgi:hypothetical protein
MARPDDIAAQVARNVQHAQRLGALYKTASQPELDAARLRAELVDAAHFAGPAAAAISSPADAEQFVIRLHGLARLTQRLRQALAEEGGE